jgi:hypothetical protein
MEKEFNTSFYPQVNVFPASEGHHFFSPRVSALRDDL